MIQLLSSAVLGIARGISHAWLLFEAQRWLSQLILKRVTAKRLAQCEDRVLREAVENYPSLKHLFVPLGKSGLKIHTLVVGDQQNPPAVLLHGHSMSAAFWCRNFDDLIEMGYCVYAIDLLGWGRSDRPQWTGSTAEDCVEWYVRSFNAWRLQMNLDRFLLVGHSLGAYVSMEFTYQFPEAVEELLLVAPAAVERRVTLYRGFYFSLPPACVIRRGGLLGLLIFFLKYPSTPEYNTPSSLWEYAYQLASQPNGSGDDAARTFISWDKWRPYVEKPLLDRIEPIDVPIHLVGGEKDCLTPVDHVKHLYAALSSVGARVTLYTFDDADHCPMLERPQQFAEVLRKRLAIFQS